jgi:alanine racemase
VTAGPRARIRLDALRRNLAVARRLAPAARVLAVIKANAYGHGLIEGARAFREADACGVARLDEALELRGAGIRQPIVVLEGVLSTAELDVAAIHDIELVIHSQPQLELLAGWNGAPLGIWLKVDTGMNRLGFRPETVPAVWRRLASLRSIAPAPRVMTHLATADEPARALTAAQIQCFRSLTDGLGVERSVANSAGVLAWPDAHCDWIRPGVMLYGISPFADRKGAELGLEPAMTLTTSLIALRHVPAGETVGYGATWVAERDALIGIAAIGYGDGYPRHAGTGTPVLVSGREVPLAGRVSMDMIAVDVTGIEGVAVGDEVELWGARLPVERVARHAGTIAYELVCGISQRVAVEWY